MVSKDDRFEEWRAPRGKRARTTVFLSTDSKDNRKHYSGGSRSYTNRAQFHLTVKTISRSKGRSATAASAYRAGEKIVDERTGEIHDYTKRRGVMATEIVLPFDAPRWAEERNKLWNAAESAETRCNSTVGREWEVAIPYGLTLVEAADLVYDYASEIVERHHIAIDFAIHQDNAVAWDGSEKPEAGFHAHILGTTRRLGPDGFGEKSRELDAKESGRNEINYWRERWAAVANRHLERAGIQARIDHRSHRARSISAVPSRHLGPHAAAIERRGERSQVVERINAWQTERLASDISSAKAELAALEKERLASKAKEPPVMPAPIAALGARDLAVTKSPAPAQKSLVDKARIEAARLYPGQPEAQRLFVGRVQAVEQARKLYPGDQERQASFVAKAMESMSRGQVQKTEKTQEQNHPTDQPRDPQRSKRDEPER